MVIVTIIYSVASWALIVPIAFPYATKQVLLQAMQQCKLMSAEYPLEFSYHFLALMIQFNSSDYSHCPGYSVSVAQEFEKGSAGQF